MKIVEIPWERVNIDQLEAKDAIVVLSGGMISNLSNADSVEWVDPDRFFAGIDLYKASKARILLFTGSINPLYRSIPSEGSRYKTEAIKLGIPNNAIASTGPVFNTEEEAKAIKSLLTNLIERKTPNIILVTSAFHMTRAKTLFEREGIQVNPFPVDFKAYRLPNLEDIKNPLNYIPSAISLSSSSLSLREILGRIYYRTW